MTTLLAASLVSMTLAQETDTVFAIPKGSRLDIENFSGEVVVRTWNRNEMRLVADHSSRTVIEIDVHGRRVELKARARRGAPTAVDYEITVPAQIDISIGGTFTDTDIEGAEGEISVETVQGEIVVLGGRGFVSLQSVQGDVELTGARGKIDAQSVSGDVQLTDVAGEIYAETVNGDILLENVQSSDVEATTTNGDVTYEGSIEDDGRYSFTNHNGDVTLIMQDGANATVSVSTFSGEFESDFPVTLTETRRPGRRFRFTLGTGSARVQLESFNGTLQLRKR
ncbi:MAG: DUF4097 domain-containing protein [Gemmatimonadales bacterium]